MTNPYERCQVCNTYSLDRYTSGWCTNCQGRNWMLEDLEDAWQEGFFEGKMETMNRIEWRLMPEDCPTDGYYLVGRNVDGGTSLYVINIDHARVSDHHGITSWDNWRRYEHDGLLSGPIDAPKTQSRAR